MEKFDTLMKRVLGLDIGTNSIGGALILLPENYSDYGTGGKIEWMGSRKISPTQCAGLRILRLIALL
jgi:hypothetical protein